MLTVKNCRSVLDSRLNTPFDVLELGQETGLRAMAMAMPPSKNLLPRTPEGRKRLVDGIYDLQNIAWQVPQEISLTSYSIDIGSFFKSIPHMIRHKDFMATAEVLMVKLAQLLNDERTPSLDAPSAAACTHNLRQCFDTDALRRITDALAPHIYQAAMNGDWLSEQEIDNVLDIVRMQQDCQTSHNSIAGVVPHLNRPGLEPTGDHVGNGLGSLQLQRDCKESRNLLAAFVPHLRRNGLKMSGRNSCDALRGLQGQRDCPETRAAIAGLVAQLNRKDVVLNDPDMLDALYGIQGLPDCEETRALIETFVPRLGKPGSPPNMVRLCNALNGLRNQTGGPTGRLFATLTRTLPEGPIKIGNRVPGARQDKISFMEILNSVSPHLATPHADQAKTLLERCGRMLGCAPPQAGIDCDELIWVLAEPIFFRNRETLDLHGSSWPLASKMISLWLEKLPPTFSDRYPVTVICGIGNHGRGNFGGMRQVVEKTADERGWLVFPTENPGQVTLRKARAGTARSPLPAFPVPSEAKSDEYRVPRPDVPDRRTVRASGSSFANALKKPEVKPEPAEGGKRKMLVLGRGMKKDQ